MPLWYKNFAKALEPIAGHETAVLLAIAGITIIVAIKADPAAKLAWLIYLISP
jgi:hypothetical protein